MIDKQIIDEMIEKIGFDVQQCGYLKITKDALNYPEIGGTFTAFECNLYSRDCDFIERCRYKQLLRKEQECEELKHKIELMIDCASCKVDKLKQTLTEVKEIAECCQTPANCKDYCQFYNECIDGVLPLILQKIRESEMKNE